MPDKIIVITKQEIENRIHVIRGVQVILDRDLSLFYDVKTIRLREQVKRNIRRFPSDFMFQLTDFEVEILLSQNAIPSKSNLGGYLPYVFTEQGVATVSAILTSERAIEVNIQIMRAFVAMRRFISSNAQIFERLDSLEIKQLDTDKKLNDVLNALENNEIQPKQGIFFDGQVFDAYKFVCELIRKANKSIVVIDNYIDESVLDILTKKKENVRAIILTKSISKQLNLDLKKHNHQYPQIEIREFAESHDRFIIIDDTELYHFGASLKDLGKKWFAFSKMDSDIFSLISKLKDYNLL